MPTLVRAMLFWLGLLAVAVGNGAIRETFLVPRWGTLVAHQLSTASLCLLILLFTVLLYPWSKIRGGPQAFRIGALWLTLTLAFEFLAGRFLFGRTWHALFAEYDLAQGRVWLAVPVVTLLSPWLAQRLRS